MKMRNGVMVFVIIIAAMVGITDVADRLIIITKGSSLISCLYALEEYRGKCGIGENPWFGFRILATFFATISYQGLIFPCRSHRAMTLDNGELCQLVNCGRKWWLKNSPFCVLGNSMCKKPPFFMWLRYNSGMSLLFTKAIHKPLSNSLPLLHKRFIELLVPTDYWKHNVCWLNFG